MKSFFCGLTPLFLFAAGVASAQQYVINTIAGIPQVQGYFGDGALANVAQLYKPVRLALDSKGNYYIGDYYSGAVRMVTVSTGNIATIAGDGTPGFAGDNDVAIMANISDIHGIAVDSTGIVYISDTGNARIRKIDTKGIITTFAGTGTPGYGASGGAASSSNLASPAGLLLDSSGNLYVADYGNSTVRKITSSGTISTIAGTGTWGTSGDGGPASKATLAAPTSLAIDGAGNIYIGDVSSNSIRKITTDGNISTVASGVTAQSLAVDAAGNIYFVDGLNPVVQKILPSGVIVTVAGTGQTGYSGDGGQSTLAQLNNPTGIAVDTAGNIYVADTYNQIIRELTPVPFSVGSVTNSASSVQGAGIAPGEIVTLYGTGIGPSTLTQFTASGGSIGTQIAGVQVYMNGIPAPLIYVSSNLIAAIAPYALANYSTANIVISYQGKTSATTVVPVVGAAPGIFTANSTGVGQAAAVNSDGSLNSAAKPAKAGTFLSLYISGDGTQNPVPADGRLVTTTPYPMTVQQVKVNIGGTNALVSYAGATPTAVAGLTQLNVQIPANVQTGSAVPVTVQVGGVAAQAGVTIAIN